jgi:hypothetical protein
LVTNFAGDNVTTYNVGVGSSVARGNFRLRGNAGSEGTGYAGIRVRDWFINLAPSGNGNTAINYAYPFIISCQFTSINTIRDGTNRFYFGGTTTYTTGDNTVKTIGFRVLGETIYAAVHNGTTYSEVGSTSANLVDNNIPTNNTVHIYNVGNGTVIWYANGAQFASTASGPTGLSAHVESNLLIVAENSAGNVNTYLDYVYVCIDLL